MHVASVTAPVVLQHLRCITVCNQYVRAASVLKSTYFVHGLILKLSFRSISSNAAYTCCIRIACDILFCRSEIMQHKCFCCNALHFMHETHTGRCSAGIARFRIGQFADMGRSTCLLSSLLPLCWLLFWLSADQVRPPSQAHSVIQCFSDGVIRCALRGHAFVTKALPNLCMVSTTNSNLPLTARL